MHVTDGGEGEGRPPWREVLGRNVLLVILSGTVFSIPIGFVFVALPVYLERLPTVSTALIGVVITTMGLVAVALIIPFGIVADLIGRRLLLALGSVVGSAAILLLTVLDTFEGILVVAALFGVAEALYFSTWNALLADASQDATRTTVFGVSFFAGSVAFAVGSFVSAEADRAIQAGATPQAAYGPLFLGVGLLLLVAPALLLAVRLPRLTPAGPKTLLPRRSGGIIGKFLVANLLIGFGAGVVVPLFSLWFFLQFGAGEAFTGPLFALSNLVNAFAFLLAPVVARRAGMIRAVVAAQATATALLFAMPFAAVVPVVGLVAASALFVARNALMNMTWPVMSSFLMGAVHPDERSAASAVTGASFRLPFAVSASLGSYLLTVDLALPFYVTTFFYVLGTGAFWYFFRTYRTVTPERAARLQAAELAEAK